MDLLKPFKKSATFSGLLNDLDFLFMKLPMLLLRKKTIKTYLRKNQVAKLHLGAGPSRKKGWLLTDIKAPLFRGLTYLNAVHAFPFEDGSFDYIFSEHMIEHISREQGQAMLQECFRVLKPAGVLRVATPDLDMILGLNAEKPDKEQQHYIKWISDKFLSAGHSYRPGMVINNAFYNWGHRFLYDRAFLREAMAQAGFEQIVPCKIGESSHPCFQDIESHGLNIDDRAVNAFETMIFEGLKP